MHCQQKLSTNIKHQTSNIQHPTSAAAAAAAAAVVVVVVAVLSC